jgi:prepilin-type processing-associated H-X9-DG protein
VWWEKDTDGSYADVSKGVIVPYIRRFSTNLFTCPTDRTLLGFRSNPAPFLQAYPYLAHKYPFSYSFSSPWGGCYKSNYDWNWLEHGMSSTRILDKPIKNRMSSVKSPSTKIMFADVRKFYEFKVSEFASLASSGWAPGVVSSWLWRVDKLAVRHVGKGNVTLADGHVETVKPEFGEMKEHYDPLY